MYKENYSLCQIRAGLDRSFGQGASGPEAVRASLGAPATSSPGPQLATSLGHIWHQSPHPHGVFHAWSTMGLQGFWRNHRDCYCGSHGSSLCGTPATTLSAFRSPSLLTTSCSPISQKRMVRLSKAKRPCLGSPSRNKEVGSPLWVCLQGFTAPRPCCTADKRLCASPHQPPNTHTSTHAHAYTRTLFSLRIVSISNDCRHPNKCNSFLLVHYNVISLVLKFVFVQ